MIDFALGGKWGNPSSGGWTRPEVSAECPAPESIAAKAIGPMLKDACWKKLRRFEFHMCIYAFGYSELISGHGLVEVQNQVAHERPESDLVTGKSALGPAFTRASDFECVGWALG